MASGITWSTIFLGNVGEMDTDEDDFEIETASPILKTFGDGANPLYNFVTTVITNSTNGDDSITSDNVETSDTLSYDLGAGQATAVLDNAMMTKGNVAFSDGTTLENFDLAVMQDETGNAFLLILDSQPQLASKMIESVEFTSVTNSSYSGIGQFNVDSLQFLCLARGTTILTPGGAARIEDLGEGDLVATLSGISPIVAKLCRFVDYTRNTEASRPIRIRRGAFGCDLPNSVLDMSVQHRIVLEGLPPNLAAARALVTLPGVRERTGCRTIEFHALLLPHHSVISANGLAVESLLAGRQALSWMTGAERVRFMRLVSAGKIDRHQRPALPCLTRRQAEAAINAGARPARFSDLEVVQNLLPAHESAGATPPLRGSRP